MTAHLPTSTARISAVLEDFDWLVTNGESEEIAARRCGVSPATIKHYRGQMRRASEGAA